MLGARKFNKGSPSLVSTGSMQIDPCVQNRARTLSFQACYKQTVDIIFKIIFKILMYIYFLMQNILFMYLMSIQMSLSSSLYLSRYSY